MRIKKILVFIFILSFPISLFLMRGDEKVKNSIGSLYLKKSSDEVFLHHIVRKNLALN